MAAASFAARSRTALFTNGNMYGIDKNGLFYNCPYFAGNCPKRFTTAHFCHSCQLKYPLVGDAEDVADGEELVSRWIPHKINLVFEIGGGSRY